MQAPGKSRCAGLLHDSAVISVLFAQCIFVYKTALQATHLDFVQVDITYACIAERPVE